MKNRGSPQEILLVWLLTALVVLSASIHWEFFGFHETSITCRRLNDNLGHCEIANLSLIKEKKTKKISINKMRFAEVKTDLLKSIFNDGYRVKKLVIKTWVGKLYIANNRYSFNRNKIFEIANKINAFINNKNQKYLKIEYGDLWEVSLYNLMFLGVVVWTLIVAVGFL
ncbi:hypothetical protein IQ249_20645 [Lusitaniella coriacea LEGE 07157]|uniref:Uncharacterized protein n=1 Tax=Lusitaniella coriacea LEGE 07157 TaxID=945747 RepID=A0A8J7JEL4_9CYAN|nr:hypothetical protein [Lusitaniella coriacea]MBE9118305.1 hypothetical protein [Lusitaniella coriacea LEGE 07157]